MSHSGSARTGHEKPGRLRLRGRPPGQATGRIMEVIDLTGRCRGLFSKERYSEGDVVRCAPAGRPMYETGTTRPSGLPEFCYRVLRRHRTSVTGPLGGPWGSISRLSFAAQESAVSGPSADVAKLTHYGTLAGCHAARSSGDRGDHPRQPVSATEML